MEHRISTRHIVRIVSFSVALVGTLAGLWGVNAYRAEKYRLAVEYSYLRSVEELSSSVDNIKNTLGKSLYAGTPEMVSNLSTKLWKDASTAKSSLSQLPIKELSLENTYKFLSQVGDYALSMSKKVSKGQSLTEEEQQNLEKLHTFSEQMSADMWELEQNIGAGKLTFEQVKNVADGGKQPTTPQITEGFAEFEEGFDSYPTLIYDGPFSDHIQQREPLMTKDATEIPREKAKEIAATALGVPKTQLVDETDEAGRMPTYSFSCDDRTIAITKQGGYVCYLIDSRSVDRISLGNQQAVNQAQAFLERIGFSDMKATYYENTGNMLIINFAYQHNGTIVYPDLVKVGVALDNGEVMMCDTRGYLVNHTQRPETQPKLSQAQAQQSLNNRLTVEKCQRAVIPSDGLNEVDTYEFLCTAPDGQQLLVYVNADTGAEEQILMLLISESGTLAM